MIVDDESIDCETELSSEKLTLGIVEPYSDNEAIEPVRSSEDTSEGARGGARTMVGVGWSSSRDKDTSVLASLMGT